MIREILREEMPGRLNEILINKKATEMEDAEFCQLSLAFYQLLLKIEPNNTQYLSRIGETYHLMTHLTKAAEYYKKVIEMEPPQELSSKEKEHIFKFTPVFYVLKDEPFDLLDVIAIHHPTKPLIAYHVFWEDDYDFPDDFEPCDHEEVWVEYDPDTERVTGVATWFHGFIHRTEEAIELANENDGKVEVLIEWGKHGSILRGWEEAIDPITNIPIKDVLLKHYESVCNGGMKPDHPLKQSWPKCFERTFEDYIDFIKKIETGELLNRKQMMIKSNYSSAVIQQYFLRYNFHPKYDWPF